jgi:hypothetical protein
MISFVLQASRQLSGACHCHGVSELVLPCADGPLRPGEFSVATG